MADVPAGFSFSIKETTLAPLGPLKMEIVHLENVSTGDFFYTALQRPLFAEAHRNSSGNSQIVCDTDTAGKNVIFSDAALNGTVEVTCIVYGF